MSKVEKEFKNKIDLGINCNYFYGYNISMDECGVVVYILLVYLNCLVCFLHVNFTESQEND